MSMMTRNIVSDANLSKKRT
jgi:hypothetical protein